NNEYRSRSPMCQYGAPGTGSVFFGRGRWRPRPPAGCQPEINCPTDDYAKKLEVRVGRGERRNVAQIACRTQVPIIGVAESFCRNRVHQKKSCTPPETPVTLAVSMPFSAQ